MAQECRMARVCTTAPPRQEQPAATVEWRPTAAAAVWRQHARTTARHVSQTTKPVPTHDATGTAVIPDAVQSTAVWRVRATAGTPGVFAYEHDGQPTIFLTNRGGFYV